MKAVRIVSKSEFAPIEVTVTIESQDEVDSLLLAFNDLCMREIDSKYDFGDRCIWVDTIDAIAGAMV